MKHLILVLLVIISLPSFPQRGNSVEEDNFGDKSKLQKENLKLSSNDPKIEVALSKEGDAVTYLSLPDKSQFIVGVVVFNVTTDLYFEGYKKPVSITKAIGFLVNLCTQFVMVKSLSTPIQIPTT